MHGGKSLRGLASPSTIHGRYSKDLPTRLASRYDQARTDPFLLELRDEIGVIESRLSELLQRIDSGESWDAWQRAQDAYMELQKNRDNVQQFQHWYFQLGQIIQKGIADYHTWMDIGVQMDRKQRLVESERKRLVEQQQTMTSEQAMLLFQALFKAVATHVGDRQTRAAIQADFERLVDRPEPRVA